MPLHNNDEIAIESLLGISQAEVKKKKSVSWGANNTKVFNSESPAKSSAKDPHLGIQHPGISKQKKPLLYSWQRVSIEAFKYPNGTYGKLELKGTFKFNQEPKKTGHTKFTFK